MTKSMLLVSVGLATVLSLNLGARDGEPLAAAMSRDAVVGRLVAPDTRPLVQYRAVRRLTAATRGGRMAAEMVAITTFDEHGFTYEVLCERGSSLIRRRVLRGALEAEAQGQALGNRDQGALSLANYDFPSVSEAPDHLVRLEMKPRKKHPLLIDGALFFDPQTTDLVRMEGELSKRPSFWTRRARIIRDYARVEGVRVPVSMRSTADVLITGVSTFDMAYEYLEINGEPVSN